VASHESLFPPQDLFALLFTVRPPSSAKGNQSVISETHGQLRKVCSPGGTGTSTLHWMPLPLMTTPNASFILPPKVKVLWLCAPLMVGALVWMPLTQKWFGRVWLNPPYSRPNLTRLMRKAYAEVQRGHYELVCCLLLRLPKLSSPPCDEASRSILIARGGNCQGA
jgi:hypothetical protein